jgi:predicted Zn finger-like uncharacterized protein
MPYVTCPACSATTYVSLDAANRLIKCPRCSAMFLAPGAVPRRRWGCSSVLLAGLLITASGLWRPFRPTAAGNDRDLAPPGSYHPATVGRP